MAKKTKIVAYLRVSTAGQELENQEFEIKNYAERNNLEIDEWISDVISGSSKALKRVGGVSISSIPNKSVLIVTELSRIGRSMFDINNVIGSLVERGVHVHLIKQSFVVKNDMLSKVFLMALSVAAEMERDLIGQRTREALRRRKFENRKYAKNTLYGFKVNEKEITPDKKELDFVLKVFSLSGMGFGVRKIASEMSKTHKPLRNSKEIYPTSIQQILDKKEDYVALGVL